MALRGEQFAVTTSPQKLFDGIVGTVTICGSAAYYLGGNNVSTTNGLPCPANVPIPLTVTGEAVYAITGSSANIGYLAGGQ
jgi:hypothetical protein